MGRSRAATKTLKSVAGCDGVLLVGHSFSHVSLHVSTLYADSATLSPPIWPSRAAKDEEEALAGREPPFDQL
ncbi:hypothetical protein HanIR_Chr11g0535061 [Helianthus annuus]|nr:hypothetical protein HanIR_Chr11g0535061 [Helianthus annuus]